MEHLYITDGQLAVSGLIALAIVVAGIVLAEMRSR
jgi:hypothetical protein